MKKNTSRESGMNMIPLFLFNKHPTCKVDPPMEIISNMKIFCLKNKHLGMEFHTSNKCKIHLTTEHTSNREKKNTSALRSDPAKRAAYDAGELSDLELEQ